MLLFPYTPLSPSSTPTTRIPLIHKSVLHGSVSVAALQIIPSVPSFSVQSLSHVGLFATPWTAAHQASLSTTNSWSLLKLMSIASVMPSHHLILCSPLFFPPSILPSIRVFLNESVLCIRWPKYCRSLEKNIALFRKHAVSSGICFFILLSC